MLIYYHPYVSFFKCLWSSGIMSATLHSFFLQFQWILPTPVWFHFEFAEKSLSVQFWFCESRLRLAKRENRRNWLLLVAVSCLRSCPIGLALTVFSLSFLIDCRSVCFANLGGYVTTCTSCHKDCLWSFRHCLHHCRIDLESKLE